MTRLDRVERAMRDLPRPAAPPAPPRLPAIIAAFRALAGVTPVEPRSSAPIVATRVSPSRLALDEVLRRLRRVVREPEPTPAPEAGGTTADRPGISASPAEESHPMSKPTTGTTTDNPEPRSREP
jgi:hypothetical protein